MRRAAFPLALAWLDCPPGAADATARGNFVAIGTMLPGIEIWDLDLLDAVEPAAVLGDMLASMPGKSAKKNKKSSKNSDKPVGSGGQEEQRDTHTGAVMALAWNGASHTSACLRRHGGSDTLCGRQSSTATSWPRVPQTILSRCGA